MTNRLTLLLLLCGLSASSCFFARERVNRPIDREAYLRLEPGVSNETDVLRELGAPSEVVQLGDNSAWRYDHTQSKIATIWPILVVFLNKDTQQDRVWAFFNDQGLLTNLGGSFLGDQAAYRMPWSD